MDVRLGGSCWDGARIVAITGIKKYTLIHFRQNRLLLTKNIDCTAAREIEEGIDSCLATIGYQNLLFVKSRCDTS
jgi:hypothetical protein